MKMKLSDLAGKVITIKSDHKEAKRCYENNLKTKRGVSMVITRPPYTKEVFQPEVNCIENAWTKVEIACKKKARESRPDPFGDPGEREQHPRPNGGGSECRGPTYPPEGEGTTPN